MTASSEKRLIAILDGLRKMDVAPVPDPFQKLETASMALIVKGADCAEDIEIQTTYVCELRDMVKHMSNCGTPDCPRCARIKELVGK